VPGSEVRCTCAAAVAPATGSHAVRSGRCEARVSPGSRSHAGRGAEELSAAMKAAVPPATPKAHADATPTVVVMTTMSARGRGDG